MQPVPAASDWKLPPIESAGALADWLWLDPGDLQWVADLKGLGSDGRRSQLGHYHYCLLAKEFGSVRVMEAPKLRLKKLQREILTGILDKIPSHPAVHGFVEERSIKTFTAPHVGKSVVLRMDLRDFFVSFSGPRIQTFFRTVGYPETVADLLGGICTNASPREIFSDGNANLLPVELVQLRSLYLRPHLPQGAPTSPALANFCFYRVDCRLAGLAQRAGAEYTRYADDLAFPGKKHSPGEQRSLERMLRQSESQNRQSHPAFCAHLDGRVAFVEMVNPEKAKRLRKIFEQIRWR